MNLTNCVKLIRSFTSVEEADSETVKHYSEVSLMGHVQEECGELISAINKYNRASGVYDFPTTSVSKENAYENLKEELGDVISLTLLLADKLDVFDYICENHISKASKQLNMYKENHKE